MSIQSFLLQQPEDSLWSLGPQPYTIGEDAEVLIAVCGGGSH